MKLNSDNRDMGVCATGLFPSFREWFFCVFSMPIKTSKGTVERGERREACSLQRLSWHVEFEICFVQKYSYSRGQLQGEGEYKKTGREKVQV